MLQTYRHTDIRHTDIRHTDAPTKRVLEEHSLLKSCKTFVMIFFRRAIHTEEKWGVTEWTYPLSLQMLLLRGLIPYFFFIDSLPYF